MKRLTRSHRLAALAAILLTAGAARAQDLPPDADDGPPQAYGASIEQLRALARGEDVEGWIRLDQGGELLSPAVARRPPAPCALPPAPEATINVSLWPGGVVPYEFDANVTVGQQNAALAALGVIQAVCEVTFLPRNGESGYLHIQDDNQNSSSTVGYGGGQTTIRLFNWGTQGIIVHEILHAMGFHHEQNRPDRDSYVQIVSSNIQSGYGSQFSKQSGVLVLGPYDFGSVMHYDGCSFSICCPPGFTCSCPSGCETILALPPYAAFQTTMGQRLGMSTLDVHGMRSLYPQSHWRFVDPGNPGAGNGTGTNPWQQLSSALGSAPSGARVFALAGNYSAQGTWTQPMTVEAPLGGVVAR